MTPPPAFDAASTVGLLALLVTLAFRFVDSLSGRVREARAVVWDKTVRDKQRKQLTSGLVAAVVATAVPAGAAALLWRRARIAFDALDDTTQPRLVPALVLAIGGLLVVLAVANAVDAWRVLKARRRWARERAARLIAGK